MWIRPVLSLSVMLACGSAAFAQTAAEPAPPAQNCQADSGQQSSDGSTPSTNSAPADSSKLEACDGVLKPPPSGDGGITQPAPDAGKTPVVKPGEVPEQSPQQ